MNEGKNFSSSYFLTSGFDLLGLLKPELVNIKSPLPIAEHDRYSVWGPMNHYLALLMLVAKEGKMCLSTMASSLEKQPFISEAQDL